MVKRERVKIQESKRGPWLGHKWEMHGFDMPLAQRLNPCSPVFGKKRAMKRSIWTTWRQLVQCVLLVRAGFLKELDIKEKIELFEEITPFRSLEGEYGITSGFLSFLRTSVETASNRYLSSDLQGII